MGKMRRRDREITDSAEIDRVILSCGCCRLGFSQPDGAYIVPLSFGYSHGQGERVFHFHGAKDGRKIDLIKVNPLAGFELDTGYELVPAEEACGFSARFVSVIGTGIIRILKGRAEKARSLAQIMEHATGRGDWTFSERALDSAAVFTLTVLEISCKAHP